MYTAMNDSVENAVIVALTQMGVCPAHGTLLRTFALCEGHVVAQKFFYDGGYAAWAADSGSISFYDDGGRQLPEGRVAA
jgi:hypothetical protein